VTAQIDKMETLVEHLIEWGVKMGGNIIGALIIYIIGRFLISLIKRLLNKVLERRNVDPSVKSFVKSLVNILLTVLLIVAIVNKLGVETTSFAALLASAGVAIGMALSGQLQNFAGGLIILLLRPYKIGDFIETKEVMGYVKEIQIFHTILTTFDHKDVYLPNGSMTSNMIVNHTQEPERRVDVAVSMEYGQDFEVAKAAIEEVVNEHDKILKKPAPFIFIKELGDSSVDLCLWAWVKNEDYWPVYLDMNRRIYLKFNQKGISFPFPQVTVHQAGDKPGAPTAVREEKPKDDADAAK